MDLSYISQNLTPLNDQLLNLCLNYQDYFPNTDSPEEIKKTLDQTLDQVYDFVTDEDPNLVKGLTCGVLDHCIDEIDSYAIAQAYFNYVKD